MCRKEARPARLSPVFLGLFCDSKKLFGGGRHIRATFATGSRHWSLSQERRSAVLL